MLLSNGNIALGKDGLGNPVSDSISNVGSPMPTGCPILPRADTGVLIKVVVCLSSIILPKLCQRYVETLLGSKRFLSKINFGSSKEKVKAQRQAVNSICQGSAADVIKVAIIKIHTVVSGGSELPGTDSGSSEQFSILRGRCRIMLQVGLVKLKWVSSINSQVAVMNFRYK